MFWGSDGLICVRRAVLANLSGSSIAGTPIFSGRLRDRLRANGAVKSAPDGRLQPGRPAVSTESGSMNSISYLRPLKWATAVTAR